MKFKENRRKFKS